MDLTAIISLVQSTPMLVFALVLLNREMKKREQAEDRERAVLRHVAGLEPEPAK